MDGSASVIPPGNSAADQYTEGFPTGAGEKKTTYNPGDGSGKALKATAREEFLSLGPVGTAAMAFAEVTTPGSLDGSPNSGRPRQNGATGEQVRSSSTFGDDVSGNGGTGEVIAQALGGSDGMGILLPVLLIATATLGVLFFTRSLKRSR